ncbi:hypothetical protein M513_08227 [Trichuris suis]|uniref:Uncharacterized protein n=1 Tax=Trichuris suis TaxID=68888 RepID=A0A085M118_9BILA|nr:hypothetical protein M513_08227 [Trichuris suis]
MRGRRIVDFFHHCAISKIRRQQKLAKKRSSNYYASKERGLLWNKKAGETKATLSHLLGEMQRIQYSRNVLKLTLFVVLLKLANMKHLLTFSLLLLVPLVIGDIPKKRVKRYAPPVQLCSSCYHDDFDCWTHCNPKNMSWSGPCYHCIPGDWKCLKFCRHPPYPIPPYCDKCPLSNYMCMAYCTPRPEQPRPCCHECHTADVLCYKTCVYCQPYNPWPCYQCAYDHSEFCKEKCSVRPPCSQCYDWDPDYVRCLRVCVPVSYGPYAQSYPPQCNVDVWGSWCADSWFQGLSQAERAALLRQVMLRLDTKQPDDYKGYKNLIYMPSV